MTRTVEQQARRYLRIFPRWMRAERGEEAVGLTLDQLSPDATRLPAGTRLDLIRAGLHARRRGTPPPSVWSRLTYQTVFRSDPVVPSAWRPWLASVITTRWITAAYAVHRTLPFLVAPIMQLVLPGTGGRSLAAFFAIGYVAAVVGLWAFGGERWRQRVLLANGFGADGRPLPPDQVGRSWSRQTMPNTWTVPALVGFVLAGGVYAPVAWFQADRVERANVLLVATVLALVAWGLATGRRRLDRLGPAPAVSPASDGRVRNLLSLASGAGLGLIWSWLVAFAAEFIGLPLVVVWLPPAAALAVVVLVRRTEGRIGRRVGEWDLHPAWAPQLVQRPVDQLPAPPSGPSTPALG